MQTEIPPAEFFLLGGGVALWVLFICRRRASWRFALPHPAVPPEAPAFDALHAAIPIIWYFGVQSLLHRILVAPAITADSSTTAPVALTAGAVLANALTQVSTCMLIVWMARQTGSRGAAWIVGRSRPWHDFAWAAIAYLLCWPLIFFIAAVTETLLRYFVPTYVPSLHTALTFIHDPHVPATAKALAVVSAAVLAPLMEEWYFRGVMQNVMTQLTRSPWAGIGLSAALFGAIHGDLPQNVPALTLFGAALGYVYYRTGSLMAAVWLHAIFNTKTLLFLAWYGPSRS